MPADLRNAVHAVDSASVMGLLSRRPRMLGLGEPTHGEEALLGLRNELFRQLVEREGYRTIAVESDCMMGLVVDDYVTTGAGDLGEVMERGFSHGWGAYAGNRELVQWMRAYNEEEPAAPVRFAGFDGPLEMTGAASPRQALSALHAYLSTWVGAEMMPCTAEKLDELLGADGQWTHPDTLMDPSQSVGQTPQARQLRIVADDLVALLVAQTPHLRAVSSPDEWDRARLFGRTATGLLRYHHWLADTSPGRLAWLLGVRDSMMAANLLALAERDPVLVSAHNSHLQRDKSSMRLGDLPLEWWSAGAIVSAELGDAYAHVATAVGTISHHGVDVPEPATLEGLLYALPGDRYVVDTRELAGVELAPRVSTWYGYAPVDPAQIATFDGMVFVKDSAQS